MLSLIKFIGRIYSLTLPVILGGVCNMIYMKTPVLSAWRVPMDGGRTFRGKRIFGDNKTWKGFTGMIFFTALWGGVCWGISQPGTYLLGAWLGFVYVLFELPNSFIKRRLNRPPGTNGGILQTFFDQADSVFGIILFHPVALWLSLKELLGMFLILILTHLGLNFLLFALKLRKQKS